MQGLQHTEIWLRAEAAGLGDMQEKIKELTYLKGCTLGKC